MMPCNLDDASPAAGDPLKAKVISPVPKGVSGLCKGERLLADSESAMASEKARLKKLHTRRLMLKTLCNSVSLLVLGMMLSMKGPSFIDLQLITGTDVEGGSAFFTAYAFGYMIGSLIAGAMYNRVDSKALLIMVPMVLAGLTCAVTPYCDNYLLMILVHALNAGFSSIFETTANTEEVHNWEGKSDSAMQFLSFTYSLGGIVGPLLVQPFLAPELNVNIAAAATPTHTSTSTSSQPLPTPQAAYDIVNSSDSKFLSSSSTVNHTLLNNSTGSIRLVDSVLYSQLVSPRQPADVDDQPLALAHEMPSALLANNSHHLSGENYSHAVISGFQESFPSHSLEGYNSRIHVPYLIAGIMSVVAAVPFFLIYLRSRRKAAAAKKALAMEGASSDKRVASRRQKLPVKVYVMLMSMLSIFYFFYTTVDDPFSMYLSVFVVSHLKWSKESGASVSAIYWVCSTVTKLAMVILVRHVNASVVMLASTAGMVLSTLLFIVASSMHAHQLIWVATALLALSQSAIFGGGFAWADSNLLRLDGRVTSCTIFFASLGAMVDPMLIGVSMKELSPMAFPYLMFGQSVVTFLLFLAMLLLARPYVLRRFGPPRGSITVGLNAPVDHPDVESGNDQEERDRENTPGDVCNKEHRQPGLESAEYGDGSRMEGEDLKVATTEDGNDGMADRLIDNVDSHDLDSSPAPDR